MTQANFRHKWRTLTLDEPRLKKFVPYLKVLEITLGPVQTHLACGYLKDSPHRPAQHVAPLVPATQLESSELADEEFRLMRKLEEADKRDAQAIADAEFASLQDSQVTGAAYEASQRASQGLEAKRYLGNGKSGQCVMRWMPRG